MSIHKNILSFIYYSDMFKGLQKNLKSHHAIALLGFLILILAVSQFSDRKHHEVTRATNIETFAPIAESTVTPPPTQSETQVQTQQDQTQQVQTQQVQTQQVHTKDTAVATDLMPGGGISQPDFLSAGHHIGINTIGSSLRNANLQIRSECPNPQNIVCPWNQSTIGPDLTRRPLDVKC